MDTETLDKLYLEWSQFTRARTAREQHYTLAVHTALAVLRGDPTRVQHAIDLLQNALTKNQ